MTNHRIHHRRGGFTMVELLVVVGLILFLMSISIVALNGALGIARERATQTTIRKVHGLMQQRIDAFNRAMERTNLELPIRKWQRDLQNNSTPLFPPPIRLYPSAKVLEVMVRKDIFRTRFPQNFAETNGGNGGPPTLPTGITYVSANHQQVTESSALMYWILTSSEVYGIAPVDESEFNSSEVRDTDGDGLKEFVDGWGQPLRFYRWPTHLFRPGTSPITAGAIGATTSDATTFAPVVRTYANVLWSGLPAAPTVLGEFDLLSRDPDDPTGQLRRFVNEQLRLNGSADAISTMTFLQNQFGTPNTYHAFLIVSAGPDSVRDPTTALGMEEPYNPTTVSGTSPVLGAAQGRFGAITNHIAIEQNPINDNLTNRQR